VSSLSSVPHGKPAAVMSRFKKRKKKKHGHDLKTGVPRFWDVINFMHTS
jgi:hypothetical protein